MYHQATRRLGINDLGPVPLLDAQMREAGNWAAFKFEEAYLIGAPEVITAGGPTNLLLASNSDFHMTDVDPFDFENPNTGHWNRWAADCAMWL